MIKTKIEKTKCTKCGKEYNVILEKYPTKLDDKRETYYNCPYCNNIIKIQLNGDEEVHTEKIQ